MLAFLFACLLSWSSFGSFTARLAPQPPLVLQPGALRFSPALFTVATLHDARPGRPAVAWLLPVGTSAPAQPVELQGGTEAALRQFVARSLPQQPARYAVTVRVLECRVQETPAANQQAAGQVTVHLAFDWQNADGQTITLTEYRGGARYRRPLANQAVVAPTLQQALLGGFTYLQQWLTLALPRDVRLATAVHPTFRYETRQTEPDTLFYDPARPLTWADFTGQPRPRGQYAAAVFPGFAYQGRPHVLNGVVQLPVHLKIYVVRSSSWVAPEQRTPYNLNHEQRHFDIVRLVAERFRRKISPDSLTVQDYNSILQWQYLQSFTEMNRVQEQYDQETRGGTDTAAQARWDQRLTAELRGYGIGSGGRP